MTGSTSFAKATTIGFSSWVISYFQPLWGVIIVFSVIFAMDFITGLLASFKRGECFNIVKARDSFLKVIVYIGSFLVVLAVAKEVACMGGTPISDTNVILTTILKVVVTAAIWFEAKSNVENLKVLFPRDRFIAFLDYLLGVEFLRSMPWLKGF